MRTKITCWTMALFGVAAVLGATRADAATVYSQIPPNDSGSRVSDFSAGFLNQQAQRFTLSADSSILTIVAWGKYDSGLPADDFTIRFFSDSGGAPPIVPFEQQTGVPVTREASGLPGPIYRYTFALATPVMLSGGTVYYVSIVNNTSDPQAWSWSEVSSGPNNLRWHRGSDASSWTSVPNNLAFELSDSTPTPTPTPGPPTGVPTTSPSTLPVVALLLALLGVWTLRPQRSRAKVHRRRD